MSLVLIVFLAMCGATLVGILIDTRRVFQFPWLMGTVFAGFIAPQLVMLSSHLNRVPPEAFDAVALMAVLCLACCWGGGLFRPSPRVLSWTRRRLDENRLYQAGIALLVVGTIAGYLTGAEAENGVRDEYGNWTGRVTIYAFFAGLVQPAISILFRRAILRPSMASLGMVAFALQGPVVAAVYYGRREPTVLTSLTIAMTLYFTKGLRPPRLVVLAAIVGVAVFIPITSQYRAVVRDEGLDALQKIDLVESLGHAYESGHAPEVTLAAYCIDGTRQSDVYGLGRAYWNNMVFRFVPAQVVGKNVKESLQFSTASAGVGPFEYGVRISPGTTTTGLADAFQQFGYLGCLVFLAMAWLYNSLWYAVTYEKSIPAQLFYIQNIVSAMRALTHQTTDLPPALIYNLVFLGMVYWWARGRRGRA